MFVWINHMFNNRTRLNKLERKVEHMSQELDDLKHSVDLIKKAVGEAVGEIQDLAKQLADVANKPNPEKADIEAVAADLTKAAETLHGAVYPPSSHVTL